VLLGILPPARSSDAHSVAELRHAITDSEEIPGLGDFNEHAEQVPLIELTATAHQAWRAYVDGRHSELLLALPSLLLDSRRLAHTTRDDSKAAAHRVLSIAYRLGAGLAGRFGLDDLAWTAAERALRAARHSDSPDLETAISLRYLVWALVRQGRTEDAERVAVKAAEQIEPRMLNRVPVAQGCSAICSSTQQRPLFVQEAISSPSHKQQPCDRAKIALPRPISSDPAWPPSRPSIKPCGSATPRQHYGLLGMYRHRMVKYQHSGKPATAWYSPPPPQN
jgi:hypothetical protein